MPHRAIVVKTLLFVLVWWAAVSSAAWAGCGTPVAELVAFEGTVTRRPAAGSVWQRIGSGETLCQGDYVQVARNSRGTILFSGAETVVRLDQNSTLQILTPDKGGKDLSIGIERGIASFLSRVKRYLSIGTPFMNGSVEGTEFMVSVDASSTRIDLYEGEVLVSNPRGELRLKGRQSARAGRDEAPRFHTLVNPEDAVQWSLHYEPVLAALLSNRRDDAPVTLIGTFREAASDLRGGDSDAAFARLSGVTSGLRDAGFFGFRAALYLTVGRVEEAEADLATAQRLAPEDADTPAIASVIALSRNDKASALTLATQATERGADRALPWLVLSYVRQAHFDLEGAEAAVRRALGVDPGNGLLQARRAELLLALGDFDTALAAAREAQAEAPEVALTHRALGFTELVRLDVEAARTAFYRAIFLDQGDPLSWLGLGLAMIRKGELAVGREHLEIAVALGPRRSLLRSYLGKAYYEEKRDGLATTQYELAAEQDPRDPTPWLYRAILLQQHNRPVEALQDLERSISLNDNRAVYRARLQLDADAAARSANLGRIYRDLGFEQMALLEGWKSAATAPDDYSGHRLLADVYGVLPRHEEARVSELLQAQLLQPLNAAPVQPVMAETRLLVPDGLAPAAPGLNEYGSLFARDGGNAWVSALVGNHRALGDEILASGLDGRTAFSLGQYHYDIEGGSGVVPQRQDILVGFMQHQLTPVTSVQGEVRYTDTDEGPYDVVQNAPAREQEQSRTARLGLRHQWSPGSVLIASFIHLDIDDFRTNYGQYLPHDPASLVDIDLQWLDRGWSAELRQDWRSDGLRISAGIGFFDLDQDQSISAINSASGELNGMPGINTYQTEFSHIRNNHFLQAYTYLWWDLTPQWELNLGLSYDYLKESLASAQSSMFLFRSELPDLEIPLVSIDQQEALSRSKGQLNPKLGIIWRPWADTTLRAAAFHSLRRPKAVKQTIEPTQVAGFNQMFDGEQGEEFWRYGIGLDKKISRRLSAGLELSRRDRSYFVGGLGEADRDVSLHERFGRAYFYWTPTPRLTATAEYFYEQEVIPVGDGSVDDITHRLPLTLAYFHPAGPYGRLRGSYVEQSGNWPELLGERQSETFWNWDLELGYRLPKRRGLISLQVNNLLDQRFDYRETDENHPLFVPERTLSLRASLQF